MQTARWEAINFTPGLTSRITLRARPAMADTIIKTFEFKIKPTRDFTAAAARALDASSEVYNCALAQRVMRYRQGKPIGFFEQSRELTDARTLPHVGRHLRTIQIDALERLDFAFKAFFRLPLPTGLTWSLRTRTRSGRPATCGFRCAIPSTISAPDAPPSN